MKTHKPEPVRWGRHALQPTYDVAIIGAGVHGLAAAYYLGKIHGIRKVALLEKGYIGCGNSDPQHGYLALQSTAPFPASLSTTRRCAFTKASPKSWTAHWISIRAGTSRWRTPTLPLPASESVPRTTG